MADELNDSRKELRLRAERKLNFQDAEPQDALSLDDAKRLLHELRVHQIELEMQNEELRLTQIELDASRARYFDLYDLAPVGYCAINERGSVLEANLTATTLLGVTRKELVDKPISRFIFHEDQDIHYLHCKQLFKSGNPNTCELRMLRGGMPFWARLEASVAQVPDAAPFCRITLSDITARKVAETALKDSEAKLRGILDNIGLGVSLISPKMEILELNRQMREWFPSVDPSLHPSCFRAFNAPSSEEPCVCCPVAKTLEDGLVHETTMQIPMAGVIRDYRVVSSPVAGADGKVAAVVEMLEDITDKLSLESQLLQAQKMEAIGLLAGGVAHDFNNMLAVIIGRTELALKKVDPALPVYASLQEILKAAGRSTDLTRQLLAFARRQAVCPKVIDLNEPVDGILKMLRRLIGEDIELVWKPRPGGCRVEIDPSQVDQILTNLCVNAHDAIAGVGKIVIETNNVVLDEAYCAGHPGFVPGDFAMLSVSDSGCGMDKKTQDRMFEPFFTTKAMGKGSGLGLAMVYGIVKQNKGFIDVDSKLGAGATFNIYLPRCPDASGQRPEESHAPKIQGGHETILLVEDEPAIMIMAKEMLADFGYNVLASETPAGAIEIANERAGDISLLLTDVVMPKMNGVELAKELVSRHPQIKCLFMSGYSSNVLIQSGMLAEDIHYLQKPFSMAALASKVRGTLDGE